jgi:hypothetical protein
VVCERGDTHRGEFVVVTPEAFEQDLVRGALQSIGGAQLRVEQAEVIRPRCPTTELDGELRGGSTRAIRTKSQKPCKCFLLVLPEGGKKRWIITLNDEMFGIGSWRTPGRESRRPEM